MCFQKNWAVSLTSQMCVARIISSELPVIQWEMGGMVGYYECPQPGGKTFVAGREAISWGTNCVGGSVWMWLWGPQWQSLQSASIMPKTKSQDLSQLVQEGHFLVKAGHSWEPGGPLQEFCQTHQGPLPCSWWRWGSRQFKAELRACFSLKIWCSCSKTVCLWYFPPLCTQNSGVWFHTVLI